MKMGDFGLKILKANKDASSTNIDDYVFWSKHPPMTLLELKTVTIDTSADACYGTKSVTHDYGFFPLVIGFVSKTSGPPTTFNDQKYILPANQFAGISCGFGLTQNVSFNIQINSDSVDINYYTTCEAMGTTDCPLSDVIYTVELYFYMWELGSAFSAS